MVPVSSFVDATDFPFVDFSGAAIEAFSAGSLYI